MADLDSIIFSEHLDELMRLATQKAAERTKYALEQMAHKQKMAIAFKRMQNI